MEITIINNYKPNKIICKIIKILKNIIFKTHKKNYDFTYVTQIYDIETILTKIFYCLYVSLSWRNLGKGYNNVYAHFIRLNELGIFKSTYSEMFNTYLYKNKNSLKIVSVDTSFIYNKYGTDMIKRNKYAKNKNCSKLFLMVNNKQKPIYFNTCEGNENDSKILANNLDNVLNIIKSKCKYFLADSGFCSRKIRMKIENNNIKPLIPLNIRNIKKKNKMKFISWKKRKEIMFKNFLKKEMIIYKRIGTKCQSDCFSQT